MVLHWRRCGRAGGRRIKEKDVAQLGEHLPCKQGVESSNLFISIARDGKWAYSISWLERTPDKREVGGSSLLKPIGLTDFYAVRLSV